MSFRKSFTACAIPILLLATPAPAQTSGTAPTEKTIYNFGPANPLGVRPQDGLIADASGNLYGVASGGDFEQGAIFRLRPNADGTWTKTILYSFQGAPDGAGPSAPLVFDSAGNLYGATFGGGRHCGILGTGCGVLFELSPQPNGLWEEKVIYEFMNTVDGEWPVGGLIIDHAGNLYGVTSLSGTAFRLSPETGGKWAFTLLHTFTGKDGDGGAPNGLIMDAAGNLYGTTNNGGGECNCGIAFELSPGSDGNWRETILYQFNGGSDAYLPSSSLLFDAAGNLYGTSFYGGTSNRGTVFQLTRSDNNSWTESILYSFQGNSDGAAPEAGLVFDHAGNLFGSASGGGSAGCIGSCGTVFELSPVGNDSWQESTVWRFSDGSDGGEPSSGLLLDGSGGFFGETYVGGPNKNGIVYKLSPSLGANWQQSTLATFHDGPNGQLPSAGLIFDGAGNLYGSTVAGGVHAQGTVYKLSPVGSGWKETILYNFDIPQDRLLAGISQLVFDDAGNLYGTTHAGGGHGSGVIFELSPGSDGNWTEQTLYIFSGEADGQYPQQNGLVFDTDGNLYGTTSYGGSRGEGVVFKLSPNQDGTWTENVIHNFAGYPTDGSVPYGGVVFDQAGNLVGTTSEGGRGGCVHTPSCGVVYKLAPGSNGEWAETILHNFVGGSSDGGHPVSTPVIDQNGNLFGTAQSGGYTGACNFGCGIVYELSPSGSGWKFRMIHTFLPYDFDGYEPVGNLVFGPVGDLYGTTFEGGAAENWCSQGGFCGTVFKLSPGSGGVWMETILHSFGAHKGDGSNPAGLVMDSLGNLYGTSEGGLRNLGIVYEIAP